MTEVLTPDTIELAGRRFKPASNTTFEQDLYIMDRVALSGVDKVELDDKSDLSEEGQRVIFSAYRSGVLFELMAGMLVEEGKPWTVESAEVNARFFSTLSDEASKITLRGVVVGVLLSFFESAVGFLKTSPKSLEKSEAERANPVPPPPPSPIAAPRSSKSGTKLSAKSRATTQTNSSES